MNKYKLYLDIGGVSIISCHVDFVPQNKIEIVKILKDLIVGLGGDNIDPLEPQKEKDQEFTII